MRVRMRVAPLPVITLFALASLGPIVIFFVSLFQVLAPRLIFIVSPLVRLVVSILRVDCDGGQQRNAQYKSAYIP